MNPFSLEGKTVSSIAGPTGSRDFAKALRDNPATLDMAPASSPLGMLGEPEDTAGAALLRGSNGGSNGGATVRGEA